MSNVVEAIGDALGNAFQMAWEVWWALILGFALSGVVSPASARFTPRTMTAISPISHDNAY